MFNTVLLCLITNYSTFTHQTTARTVVFGDAPWREPPICPNSGKCGNSNMPPYSFGYAEYEYEGQNKRFAFFYSEIVNFSNGPVGARIGPIFFPIKGYTKIVSSQNDMRCQHDHLMARQYYTEDAAINNLSR